MIIALTGQMGAGKTTVCKSLVSQGFKMINFKDALIDEVKERFPDLLRAIIETIPATMNYPSLDGLLSMNPRPILVRTLLQNYGSEVRRKDDSEYWVRKWKEKVSSLKLVCTDDCRFLNEANAVKELNGRIWRVERPNLKKSLHISETEQSLIKADITIMNTLNITQFDELVSSFIGK